jgi:hypothetical protein
MNDNLGWYHQYFCFFVSQKVCDLLSWLERCVSQTSRLSLNGLWRGSDIFWWFQHALAFYAKLLLYQLIYSRDRSSGIMSWTIAGLHDSDKVSKERPFCDECTDLNNVVRLIKAIFANDWDNFYLIIFHLGHLTQIPGSIIIYRHSILIHVKRYDYLHVMALTRNLWRELSPWTVPKSVSKLI